MKKHFKQQVDLINEAYKMFDDVCSEELLHDCIKAIKEGKSIIATALGKNVPICEKFVGTLNSLSINAHFMHTNSAIHGDLGKVEEGDVVIVLSKSGETEETIHLCHLLKERGTKNWLLTGKKDTSAEKLTHKSIIFDISQEGDPWNLVPNNSSVTFLVFLQALCMELIDRLPVKLEDFKKNHPGGNIGKILRTKK